MRMTDKTSEMGDHGSLSTHMFFVSPEAPGQDILAPRLRRAISDEQGDRWVPKAFLTCTRRTDGATIRMAYFHGVEVAAWEIPAPNIGQLSLDNGRLLVAGVEDGEGADATFHFRWDVGTGRLLAFCSTFYFDDREVEGYELYSRLHARINDSVRN